MLRIKMKLQLLIVIVLKSNLSAFIMYFIISDKSLNLSKISIMKSEGEIVDVSNR